MSCNIASSTRLDLSIDALIVDVMTDARINRIQKYWVTGKVVPNACRPASYSIHKSTTDLHNVECIGHCPDFVSKWVCPVHGAGCMGHVRCGNTPSEYMMPYTLMTKSEHFESRLYALELQYRSTSILYSDYTAEVLRLMRGKGGSVRSMNRIKVVGSLRMVIAPDTDLMAGTVVIPRWVADKVRTPVLRQGVVQLMPLREGDKALLVRQPCLWSGGMQPVTVRLGDDPTDCSMRLPMQMCSPYGADYDGDEMSLFPVYDSRSILECDSLSWNYHLTDQQLVNDYTAATGQSMQCLSLAQAVEDIAMSTTVTYSDRLAGLKLNEAHRRHMTSVSSFVSYEMKARSVMDFINAGHKAMRSGAIKASNQSDIGALCRRAKCGCERISMTSKGYIVEPTADGFNILRCPSHLSILNRTEWFGDPAQRAISKLCASVMQITLKVKSSSSLSVVSPILALLQGCTSWPCIISTPHGVHSIRMVDDVMAPIDHDCKVCYSLAHISKQYKMRGMDVGPLIEELINICEIECNMSLSNSERHCLTLLLCVLCKRGVDPEHGVQISTLTVESNIRWLVSACSQYVRVDTIPTNATSLVPLSLIECNFVGNYHSIRSISTV